MYQNDCQNIKDCKDFTPETCNKYFLSVVFALIISRKLNTHHSQKIRFLNSVRAQVRKRSMKIVVFLH